MKTVFKICKIIFKAQLLIIVMVANVVLNANAQKPAVEAINQANKILWEKFIDQYGIIRDFVGETPTPEDCVQGRPNALGWWSPIENGAFFTGLYLPAACERARRSGCEIERNKARKLAQGLMKLASVSDVPGFIARGIGTDGICHYPCGSNDQTIPWFYGLHCYLKSGIPTEKEQEQVVDKIKEVINAISLNDWKLPCDGMFKGQHWDGLKGKLYLDVSCYLYILRAMNEITQENVWLERYYEALHEYPTGADKTRLEICSAGYRGDNTAFAYSDKIRLWIYIKTQASLAQLLKLEKDGSIRAYYLEGLTQNAQNAMETVMDFKGFDNDDIQEFGHANWRKGYSYWEPQKTPEDARRLSKMGDKEKLGKRKEYEKSFVRNPLAAAAIAAFSSDTAKHEIIKQALCHYDYSKLNLSEFFFAEVAYYTLPDPASGHF